MVGIGMKKVCNIKFGRYHPKEGNDYLYVRFLRNYHLDFIAKEIELYRIREGYLLKFKPEYQEEETSTRESLDEPNETLITRRSMVQIHPSLLPF
jgi:hypothetical protein